MILRKKLQTATVCVAGAALLVSVGCASVPPGGGETLSKPVPQSVRFTPQKNAVSAPDFSEKLVDGSATTLSEMRADRVLVLQFIASWCDQCKTLETSLKRVTTDFNGAVMPVHVALHEPLGDVRDYLTEFDIVDPAIIDTDGSIWRDYAVNEPPLTAVVDTAGGLVRMWPGGAPEDELRSTLDEIVQRQSP